MIPKSTIFAIYVTFPNGESHLLTAYVEEKDARLHAERCTRQPISEDGRDVLLSAAEMLGLKAVTVKPIPVW